MDLTGRIILFCALLWLNHVTFQRSPKIGDPSPLSQGFLTLVLLCGTSLLGAGFFAGYQANFVIFGNKPVMLPVLIGIFPLVTGLLCQFIFRQHLPLKLRQTLVCWPTLINLGLISHLPLTALAESAYQFGLAILFLFITGSFLLGIQDRLSVAPIPRFLRGLPIQLITLFFIFLSLSFFRGVFFGEIF